MNIFIIIVVIEWLIAIYGIVCAIEEYKNEEYPEKAPKWNMIYKVWELQEKRWEKKWEDK